MIIYAMHSTTVTTASRQHCALHSNSFIEDWFTLYYIICNIFTITQNNNIQRKQQIYMKSFTPILNITHSLSSTPTITKNSKCIKNQTITPSKPQS